MREKYRTLSLWAVLILGILDVALTSWGLSHGGEEKNPMALFIVSLGPHHMLWGKLLAVRLLLAYPNPMLVGIALWLNIIAVAVGLVEGFKILGGL